MKTLGCHPTFFITFNCNFKDEEMDDKSVFLDPDVPPTDEELKHNLQSTYPQWNQIKDMVAQHYPQMEGAWFNTLKKYGWNFRIKHKKRTIIYLLPRENYFKVAFVFGQKATDALLISDISEQIKTALIHAVPYVEGRGIKVKVENPQILKDIKKLIEIKHTF